MRRIGIDEESIAKGQSYLALLYDLKLRTVEAIVEGNKTEAENACFSSLSATQIASIEAIAMDMSAAYAKSAKTTIPLAEEEIVHDRFHVMKLATKAVDKVRRTRNKVFLKKGDDRLTGTRFLWLTSQENLTEKQQSRFDLAYNQQLQIGSRRYAPLRIRDNCRGIVRKKVALGVGRGSWIDLHKFMRSRKRQQFQCFFMRSYSW
jgi:transposase